MATWGGARIATVSIGLLHTALSCVPRSYRLKLRTCYSTAMVRESGVPLVARLPRRRSTLISDRFSARSMRIAMRIPHPEHARARWRQPCSSHETARPINTRPNTRPITHPSSQRVVRLCVRMQFLPCWLPLMQRKLSQRGWQALPEEK